MVREWHSPNHFVYSLKELPEAALFMFFFLLLQCGKVTFVLILSYVDYLG